MHSFWPFYMDCPSEFFFGNGYEKCLNNVTDFGIAIKLKKDHEFLFPKLEIQTNHMAPNQSYNGGCGSTEILYLAKK